MLICEFVERFLADYTREGGSEGAKTMGKLVLVLAALLCVGGVLVAEGQDVRADIQRLLTLAEDIDRNVEDLEEDTDDVADDIEDVEYHIESFAEGIHDMETNMKAIKADVVNFGEEVKTTRSVLESGQQRMEQNMQSELKLFGEEVQNDTESLKVDTQCIKDDIAAMKNSLELELSDLKQQTLVLANDTQEDMRNVKNELRNDLGTKIQGLKDELHNVIDNHTETHSEIKEELASLQRNMSVTLNILQNLNDQLIILRQENANQYILPEFCSELPSTSTSGYYSFPWSSERVYCDMDRKSCGCGSPRGWMRVANIDMTDSNQLCPPGFNLRPRTTPRMCEMITNPGCTSVVFPAHRVQYSRVCGRVKAYQFGSVDVFRQYYRNRSLTIDDTYVDGVSITHGSPRNHIWTLAATRDEVESSGPTFSCPCIKPKAAFTGVIPPFVGNDYFCETGSRQYHQYRLYTEDPLWDGEGCGPSSSCCQFNSPPWFCKELPQPTTGDIEMRVCRSDYRTHEDILIEQIEMYVQ